MTFVKMIIGKIGWVLMGFPCALFLWDETAVVVPDRIWIPIYRFGSRLHNWADGLQTD